MKFPALFSSFIWLLSADASRKSTETNGGWSIYAGLDREEGTVAIKEELSLF